MTNWNACTRVLSKTTRVHAFDPRETENKVAGKVPEPANPRFSVGCSGPRYGRCAPPFPTQSAARGDGVPARASHPIFSRSLCGVGERMASGGENPFRPGA